MAPKIFDGITRKVTLAFVGLAFIGWILFVAGFGKYVDAFKNDTSFKVDDDWLYAFWAGSVLGPIVCILAVVHALLWGFPSAIVGSITAVLTIMYLSAVGFVLVYSGITIKRREIFEVGDTATADLLFAGGFLTTFFWVFILALWPWYKIDVEGQFSGF